MTTHPANQGLCRIDAIDPGFYPCLGYVRTSLIEKFPVFDSFVLSLCHVALRESLPVHLRVKTSLRGDAYIIGVQPVDFSKAEQACSKCGRPASRVDVGDGAPFFACAHCHQRMYLQVAKVFDVS